MIESTPKTEKISNNFEILNFCLDDNFLSFYNSEAIFVNVIYKVEKLGEIYDFESQFALKSGNFKYNPGEDIQAYAVLTDEQIDSFFNNLELDIAPVKVDFKIQFLDGSYNVLEEFEIKDLLFHAGYKSCIPADGSIIERSLNFNSILPFAYFYPTQNIAFDFKGKEVVFDKQKESAPNNIYQLLFSQNAGQNLIPRAFSDGFSDGFNSKENTYPEAFYNYEEAYIHHIRSSYDVKAINYPLSMDSYNIMWINESNIFQCLSFSGKKNKSIKLTNFFNEYAKNFRERKAGSLKNTSLKLNLGWSLFSEIPLLKDLSTSKIAWIFENDINEKIEMYCTSEELTIEDSYMELTEDYTLEFELDEK
ncbi:hypothetical protein [Chryseobacterium sp. FH1]|uniref:hypothetical protein n=1 Tax=Chryseobacterium sp. FH1 TaxID=1233951 RepID=UPI0004E34D0A|nr:hypothetical protein [Chryseobacterium sp. FH1]KFC19386.1 hypothetical protein IO90_08795 [Chryseobacterium sp. FH1]